MTDGTLIWSGTGVELVLPLGADSPVSLVSVHPRGTGARRGDASARSRVPASGSGEAPSGAGAAGPAPLVEVLALGHGRFPCSHRYADTAIGARLRSRKHTGSRRDGVEELRLVVDLPVPHLRGLDVRAEVIFPTTAAAWPARWDAESGALRLTATSPAPTARVVGLTVADRSLGGSAPRPVAGTRVARSSTNLSGKRTGSR